jgi:hypothetical protein
MFIYAIMEEHEVWIKEEIVICNFYIKDERKIKKLISPDLRKLTIVNEFI